ncbi:DNA methyltransferase [Kangiella japonica]|uniref:site-specific DNA-methyltransferase (adenine-specific) n=1 Tax=Kangiella japonica TaxID=647384 RepID=A0ABN0SWT9_9GAMM
MSNHISEYIEIVRNRYNLGQSSEHTFRGDLEQLIRSLVPNVDITNEPSKVTDCGNPDYVISKGKIPIGFIEAKDIGKDLNSKVYKEQFDRYKNALDNLVITDYLHFQFFQNGSLVHEVSIAELVDGEIKALEENFIQFTNLIRDFCAFISQTIKSAKRLAELMAGKARLLENTLENAVSSDDDNHQNTELRRQFEIFKDVLIHDLTPKGFADIYAQTLAYGMFAARLHDTSLNDFSRQEASELIPKTNPFLRRLFEYVAGANIDDRIRTTVDNLADVFRATNVAEILKDFGKSTQTQDPIIHFYETFLAEYNPAVRKQRGVWYTPEPVVKFIIRAVDEILKKEFEISDGLADTQKTTIEVDTQNRDRRTKTGYVRGEKQVHRVQILDPATGTGTFLAEVVRFIYQSKFNSMGGMWSSYVENELIPRLNGFELLMASYAMAHLKLDLLLTDTGYIPNNERRFNVFLTNSLEEYHPDTGKLFADWLSSEAKEANYIKRDTPVMVVVGNPPYAVSSVNKGEWIQGLIADYKKNLNERKINLDDDYIKFIRYGQHYIEKNGAGILAYITNNSFLDGVTHRQMRKDLLEGFDKIYILDLHGNSRKLETSPDGSVDQNVFDIMAGVSINIFVKTGAKKKNELGEVYVYDLYGKRDFKYETLSNENFSSIRFEKLAPTPPYYFFVKKDFGKAEQYNNGFKLDELMTFNNSGFETAKDKFLVKFTEKEARDLTADINNLSLEELSSKHNLKLSKAEEVKTDIGNAYNIKALYRPFDIRSTLISPNSKGVMFRPRFDTVRHLLEDNIALLCCKRQTSFDFQHIFITTNAVERCAVSLQTGEVSYVFPLYLYENRADNLSEEKIKKKILNLKSDVTDKISEELGLELCSQSNQKMKSYTPLDLIDYIYAVLHSRAYRDQYKEFLKIDFPKIPYPKDQLVFWRLVKIGSALRKAHLLDEVSVYSLDIMYPVSGNNIVEKITFKEGKVYINSTQYFSDIPQMTWEFYIGGYQPAIKWLKDRKGRELSFDEVLHYQKIIKALSETQRLMDEIEKIDFM